MNPLIAASLLLFLPMAASVQAKEIKPGTHSSVFQKFKDGSRGWTEADAKHSRGEWMNHRLVIITTGKKKRTFNSSRAFIEDWGITDRGSCVVIRSRNEHGPSWIEKFKLSTGEPVAECQGSEYLPKTPMWAWGWCDEFGYPNEAGEEPPAAETEAPPRR